MTKSFLRAAATAGALFFATASASAAFYSYDVSGTESWDGIDSINNTVVLIDLAAELGAAPGSAVAVDGIGWDVVIQTVGNSWLSEASVAIENSDSSAGILLSPGAGDDLAGGPEAYSSGGILDLSTAGFADIILLDGILRLEFYEEYDDFAGSVDANWLSGELNISATVVPVPAALPLLLSALGLGAFAGRRRKTA